MNLCDSLTFLHERSIVHHDLKPANLKITPEGHLFILDYGAAQYFGEPRADIPEAFSSDAELYGTEGYLPPELEEKLRRECPNGYFRAGLHPLRDGDGNSAGAAAHQRAQYGGDHPAHAAAAMSIWTMSGSCPLRCRSIWNTAMQLRRYFSRS